MKTDQGKVNGRRGRGERGAAMVEFAIIAMVLLTLAIGAFEMGMAWSDSQLVTQAARTGARSASQLGTNAAADSFSVESIEAALGSLGGNVTRIVVFEANAADGSMPSACETATPPGIAGSCSIYDGTDFGTYASWVDGSWTPSARQNSFDNADFVGVTIEVERPYMTGLFGSTVFNMSDTAVMRIEPLAD